MPKLTKKSYPLRTEYEQTDPNYRKASLFKVLVKYGKVIFTHSQLLTLLRTQTYRRKKIERSYSYVRPNFYTTGKQLSYRNKKKLLS